MHPARFAFLVHPLVPLAQRLVGLRGANPGLALGLRDGTDLDDITELARVRYRGVEGVMMGIPLLPEQLLGDQDLALRAMQRAVQLAGPVAHVGLGSVLAVVAGRGGPLQERCGIPVTTGAAATTWAAWGITESLRAGRPTAVVGAKGTVGRALTELLKATPDPQDLRAFPVVVGAHTTGGTVPPSALGDSATLVDVALPPTLSGRAERGAVVVPGERLPIPSGWERNAWGHLFHIFAGYGHDAVYACLLEPLVAVLEGRTAPWSQGRMLRAETVREFAAAAARHGIALKASKA